MLPPTTQFGIEDRQKKSLIKEKLGRFESLRRIGRNRSFCLAYFLKLLRTLMNLFFLRVKLAEICN